MWGILYTLRSFLVGARLVTQTKSSIKHKSPTNKEKTLFLKA